MIVILGSSIVSLLSNTIAVLFACKSKNPLQQRLDLICNNRFLGL
jgi:hypothetical protein